MVDELTLLLCWSIDNTSKQDLIVQGLAAADLCLAL
jgi:hypothetical protein